MNLIHHDADPLDMDKGDADCEPLIERTAGTLDDEVLKQLFVSTQQTNLELCAREVITHGLIYLPQALAHCYCPEHF